MIYLDTAALVKMIRREPESDALFEWIEAQRGTMMVSSALAEVELPRALRRTEPDLLAAAPATLRRIALYEIDELVRSTAAAYSDPHLRSLDAIHFATAKQHSAMRSVRLSPTTNDCWPPQRISACRSPNPASASP
ncbi:type II toxin-antitoxin system VapC family toxin [Nocardia sp. NPDC127579]|uniref:type II toxin-antitoxin system VapC family toxin n=1 Tax=Nocardia sp. NPDC127579 TaxID=3345402 RepID=UPI003639A99A